MKIVYITGDGRSGSTLLEMVLANIDKSVSIGEAYRFWERFYFKKSICACGEQMSNCDLWRCVDERISGFYTSGKITPAEVRERIRIVSQYKNFDNIDNYLSDPAWKDFIALVREFYVAIYEVSKCEWIVDSSKSPSWMKFLALLDIAPVYAIHLKRNLVSVANSWKKEVILPEFTEQQVMMPVKSNYLILKTWYKWNFLAAKFLRSSGLRSRLLEYESLCRDPEMTVAELADFLGTQLSYPDLKVRASHGIAGNPMRHTTRNDALVIREHSGLDNLSRFEVFFFRVFHKFSNLFF